MTNDIENLLETATRESFVKALRRAMQSLEMIGRAGAISDITTLLQASSEPKGEKETALAEAMKHPGVKEVEKVYGIMENPEPSELSPVQGQMESNLHSWQPIETLDRTKMKFVLVFADGAMRTFLWNPAGYFEYPYPFGLRVVEHDVCALPTHWMELPEAPSDPKGTDSSSATSVSSEKIRPEDWSVLDHFTSPSTPVTGIEVEKWIVRYENMIYKSNGDFVTLIRDGRSRNEVVSIHNASLERILGERRDA